MYIDVDLDMIFCKKCILIIWCLISYFSVTLSATNVTMFEYTDMMKRLFEKQTEVEQVTDFWDVRPISK